MIDPRQSGDPDDPAEWMNKAVACLTGHGQPRDLAKAREALRNAVAHGHVDAALMEIALVANGSGAEPDWRAALALLKSASRSDHVAHAHYELLRKMDLASDGKPAHPKHGRSLSRRPNVRLFERLVTSEECRHLAMVVAAQLEPSRVIDSRTGRNVAHPVRNCDNAVVGPTQEDMVVRAINLRIADITQTRASQGEPLTILRYRSGQEFRPHLDTFASAGNQRIMTVLLYLNDGFDGGETAFPVANLTVRPRGGDAVVFDTLHDGAPDRTALHAGLPVRSGTKWLATRWIREHDHDPWES